MDREQALETALGQIERQFGKGSVMKMSDQAQVAIGAVSTGSLSLDVALGVGGLPRGRVVEIYGPESSGKTTLTLHAIAQAQRLGGTCAFIDAEHAFDPLYARRLGVVLEDLLISQPDCGEQAEEVIGSGVRVKVVKNKCAPPFRQAEFEVLYGAGINLPGEIIDMGANHGVLEKSGAWYILDGERIAQGRDKACEFLRENPEV